MSFEFQLANVKPAPGLEKETKTAVEEAINENQPYYAVIKVSYIILKMITHYLS